MEGMECICTRLYINRDDLVLEDFRVRSRKVRHKDPTDSVPVRVSFR